MSIILFFASINILLRPCFVSTYSAHSELCLKSLSWLKLIVADFTAISEFLVGAMAGLAISRAAGLVVYRIVQEVCRSGTVEA